MSPKRRSDQIDTRKDGTAMVPTDRTPVIRSSQVPGRVAAMQPRGMPTAAAHASPETASSNVKRS